MICAACHEAGLYNFDANEAEEQGAGEGMVKTLRDGAERYHGKCQGCDCQHVVGQALNMELINRDVPSTD